MARRGRPPKSDDAMLNPVTIRFTRAMMDMIETVMAERIDGADKGQVIRELVLKGLEAHERERKRKK